MPKETFPQKMGLAIQDEHLTAWRKLLKPEVMVLVDQEAVAQNKALRPWMDGHSVWRGSTISEFVQNLANRL